MLNILANGNVGIGTSSPAALLALQGTSASTADLFNIASSTNNTMFIIKSSGNVGVGSSSPIATFAIVATTTSATQQIMSIGTSTQGNMLYYLG